MIEIYFYICIVNIDNGISKDVTRVLFPQTASSVRDIPFWDCGNVIYVRFQSTEVPTFDNFFWGLSENAIVYVPKGSKDSYVKKLGTENADRIAFLFFQFYPTFVKRIEQRSGIRL